MHVSSMQMQYAPLHCSHPLGPEEGVDPLIRNQDSLGGQIARTPSGITFLLHNHAFKYPLC